MHVIVFAGCSIDGFIARPDGAVDFLDTGETPADDMGFGALLERADAMLMGRNTFDFVMASGFDWPYGTLQVRVATTRDLEVPADLQSTVRAIEGTPNDLLDILRGEGFTSIYLDGGALTAAFLAEDLVDEMVLTIVPVLIGEGIRLHGPTPGDLGFEHLRTTTDPNGFVQLTWRRVRPPEE